MVICQVAALLEVSRGHELEEYGRFHEELMSELSLRAKGRMERSRWDKGVRSRCVWKQGQSLRGTVWRGAFGEPGAKAGW